MFDPFDENKTPQDKFFEIIHTANPTLVRNELEELINRMAILEIIAEDCLGDEVENRINEIKFNRADEVEAVETDLYIHTMASILTKNE